MTFSQVGQVLFSSRCLTKQLLQTGNERRMDYKGQRFLVICIFSVILTRMKTFCDCGRIYEVSLTYLTRYVVVYTT